MFYEPVDLVEKRRPHRPALVLLALLLWIAAGLLYFAKPIGNSRLPADYQDVVTFDCLTWNRIGHTEEWEHNSVIARQVDETLVADPATLKIQSTIHWTTLQGEVLYETTGVYGVDPKTGANLPTSGDRRRTGQFVFPTHTQKTTYQLWDAFYTGPRMAQFSHVERVGAMEAYVFDCSVSAFDDTQGYLYLDDVPERYHAMSEGKGRVWIEPLSGVMLDFEDEGKAFLTDAATGARGQYFAVWISKYTQETRAAHLRIAAEIRTRILIAEIGGPIALVTLGLILLLTRRILLAKDKAIAHVRGVET